MKGIIFKGEMVRAILEGRKTMTRRPVKFQGFDKFTDYAPGVIYHGMLNNGGKLTEKAPYKPGEIVYVKETWFCDDPVEAQDVMSRLQGVYYQATEVHPELFKWRPSIHMPEWASRIKLHILSVGVERIQEITPNDCISEGAWMVEKKELGRGHEAVEAFAHLWHSIYPGSWWRNDWVWKFEFEVTK